MSKAITVKLTATVDDSFDGDLFAAVHDSVLDSVSGSLEDENGEEFDVDWRLEKA